MSDSFADLLRKNFKFQPTQGQDRLFELLGKFVDDTDSDRPIFVLKGYAGTGKTAFIHSLIRTLPAFGFKSILLAPTGRAAKVMSSYTKRKAHTIHRKIFNPSDDGNGRIVFERQRNIHESTWFIIDEASMIGDQREFGQNGLLSDLVNYVFEGTKNRLLLIGDEAQLPPVNMNLSPALNIEHLQQQFFSKVYTTTLTEVMRQEEESGILENATRIRNELESSNPDVQLMTSKFKDIFKMAGDKIEDGIRYAYDKYGKENTVLITRSNKSAVQYNTLIRNRIHYFENELEVGDILMVVKNNYTLLPEESDAGFIANGEFVEVKKLGRIEEEHELRFQNITLKLVDYPEDSEFEAKVVLDTLYSNEPNLGQEQSKKLYESVVKGYFGEKSKKDQKKKIKEDPYINALQVKFAYALTCHKSQGGQWDAVFIDKMYLPEGKLDHEAVRWLYTAITRGSKEVFFVNFQPFFFGAKTTTEV
ncbi:MAG: ATP-dependent DNA helicase [Leadbetterella sp.]